MMKSASKNHWQESWFVCFIQSFKYTASKQVRRTCSFLPFQGSNFVSFHKLGRAMGNLEVQMGQSHCRVCHLKVATGRNDNSNAIRNKSLDPRPALMVFGVCWFFSEFKRLGLEKKLYKRNIFVIVGAMVPGRVWISDLAMLDVNLRIWFWHKQGRGYMQGLGHWT